jgi:hypothetical protein
MNRWAIVSRPYGTRWAPFGIPAMNRWDIVSRPYGTRWRAVREPSDESLGYAQPSLRDGAAHRAGASRGEDLTDSHRRAATDVRGAWRFIGAESWVPRRLPRVASVPVGDNRR